MKILMHTCGCLIAALLSIYLPQFGFASSLVDYKLTVIPRADNSLILINRSGRSLVVPNELRFSHVRSEGDLFINVYSANGKALVTCGTADYHVPLKYKPIRSNQSIRYRIDYKDLKELYCVAPQSIVYLQLTYSEIISGSGHLRPIYLSNCFVLDKRNRAAEVRCLNSIYKQDR